MDKTLIDKFEAGGKILADAIIGLSPSQLIARPGPGEWSIQELVIHLADSDTIGIDRMKRVVAEDEPQLLYANEGAYVQTLFCHDQSIEDAITHFTVGRRQFARVLRCLPDTAFARKGVHNVTGPVSLAELVETYVNHVDHHLGFLFKKRQNLTSSAQ